MTGYYIFISISSGKLDYLILLGTRKRYCRLGIINLNNFLFDNTNFDFTTFCLKDLILHNVGVSYNTHSTFHINRKHISIWASYSFYCKKGNFHCCEFPVHCTVYKKQWLVPAYGLQIVWKVRFIVWVY